MGSKSTHQFPTLATLEPTDLFYVVREQSPGVFKDYCAPRSLMPEALLSATVLLTSAQILDIYDTNVELIPPPASDQMIVVRLVTTKAVGGTTAYTGILLIGPTVADDQYIIRTGIPDNDAPKPYYVCYPVSAGSGVYQGTAPGFGLSIGAETTNPIDGDGDVLVKVYYSLITL